MSPRYDVIIATDPRRGEQNDSVEQEVRAHASAGYTTAIYSLFGDEPDIPMNRALRSLIDEGLADPLAPGSAASCQLLVARGLGPYMSEQSRTARLESDRRVFVVDEPLNGHGRGAFDSSELVEAVHRISPGNWEWMPTGPDIRAQVDGTVPELFLAPSDWVNIIDPDPWYFQRDFAGQVLRIGRQSRADQGEWPDSPGEIRAAYPTDSRFEVHVLGDLSTPTDILGESPQAWRSWHVEDTPVEQFLDMLHIYSHFHHPDSPVGTERRFLEALASGLPCIFPHHLSEAFGDGALFGLPSEAPEIYDELYEDRTRLDSQAETAVQTVRDRYSPPVHRARLRDLIGEPTRPRSTATKSRLKQRSEVARPNVLFFTDNGHGLGHLTRLMAIARRAKERFNPVFLTLSEAFPLLRDAGLVTEYFPSYTKFALTKAEWEPFFASRLAEAIRLTRARLIVVDHVAPPVSTRDVRARVSGAEFVWSRRGLWRDGRNVAELTIASSFDLIVEPGDIAAPIDMGLTVAHRENVVAIPPVVILGPDEQLERDEARAELGLDLDRRAVLIQLSDSDPEKLQQLIGQARDVVKKRDGSAQLFAPLHALHGPNLHPIEGVEMRSIYPVARYLNAFDAAISTAGYNSYHEIVASGLPAVFVARDSPTLDDQQRRAQFADLSGRGFWAPSVYDTAFEAAVRRMLEPDEPGIATAVTDELGAMDGADAFADLIAERCRVLSNHPLRLEPWHPDIDASEMAIAKMRAGQALPPSALGAAEVVVVVAITHQSEEVGDIADEIGRWQNVRLNFKAVFVVSEGNSEALNRWGFPYETVMKEEEWLTLGLTLPYADYARDRINGVRSRYRAGRVVVAVPGVPLPEWALP